MPHVKGPGSTTFDAHVESTHTFRPSPPFAHARWLLMLRVQRLQLGLGEEILDPDQRLLEMSARLRG